MQPGDEIPELKVTPDKYLTVRYAGASGDFNPIHIDEDFAKQVGLPGRILHGLWTMAQVARAQTEAGGGPHSLRRLAGPVPRHGRCPSTRSRSPARCTRCAMASRWCTRSPSRTARRSSATPKPRSRPSSSDLQSVWCSRRAKS